MSTLTNKHRSSIYPDPAVTDHSLAATRHPLRFDWLFMTLSLIFVSGLFLDGWAHNHGKVDQSFFTVWHAFFYAGFACTAIVLVIPLLLGKAGWTQWQLPDTYRLSLAGSLVFAAGGVGDLIWHTLFGIEEDFEALVSPTHLLLGLGIALTVTGPFRNAWQQSGKQLSWRKGLPALLSVTALISTLTFFMMFSHPLMSKIASQSERIFSSEIGQIAGTISILLTTALIMGPILLLLRPWQLPSGAIAFIWGINSVAMAVVDWEGNHTPPLLFALLVGVLAAELMHRLLQKQRIDIRLFAFTAPILLFGAYFLVIVGIEGTNWSIHLVGGTVALAGVVGWLLSYLVFPPSIPE